MTSTESKMSLSELEKIIVDLQKRVNPGTGSESKMSLSDLEKIVADLQKRVDAIERIPKRKDIRWFYQEKPGSATMIPYPYGISAFIEKRYNRGFDGTCTAISYISDLDGQEHHVDIDTMTDGIPGYWGGSDADRQLRKVERRWIDVL